MFLQISENLIACAHEIVSITRSGKKTHVVYKNGIHELTPSTDEEWSALLTAVNYINENHLK